MITLVTVLYMGFLLVVSLMRTPEGAEPFSGFDKIVHFGLYAVLGLLLSAERSRPRTA